MSSALPEALEDGLPEEAAGDEPELDLGALASELELDDTWLEADEGAARRELRRQIGRLEAELASYSRDLAPATEQPLRPREPRVAGVAELATTRDSLLAQLGRRARRGDRPRAPRAPRPRGPRRDARRPGRAPLGGRLVRGDRRARLHDLAGRVPGWARSAR